MSILSWSREFEIGVREIDQQHRNLVAIANHLHDAIESGQAPQAIDWILDELSFYTLHHFKAEERLMQDLPADAEDEHRREHKEMLKALRRFRRRFAEGDSKVARDVMAFLRAWLTQHILGTDRALAEHLRGKLVR